MTPEKYTELTGIEVEDTVLFNAKSRWVRTQLENLLGFTLDKTKVKENLYNEQGKSQIDCSYPSVDDGEYDGSLLPPDPVVFAYRLFKFNETDEYFHTDPFTKLHKAKLVYINGDIEVTLKTLENVREQRERGFTKFIERCKECFCICDCIGCVQLAIDADWLFEDDLPDDLLYLWCDLITVEMDCEGTKGIKRESVMTHTVEYVVKQDEGNTGLNLSGQQYTTLIKYAGPFGTVNPPRLA